MKRILFLIIVLAAIASPVYMQAQKALKEAYIKYEVTAVKSDDPQMEAALNMMKGSTLEIFFTENKQKMATDMMGGMMKMSTINLVDKAESIMLMDMMGRKMKIKGSDDEFAKMNGQENAMDSINYDVVYDKSKQKTIAGYPCYSAMITVVQEGVELKVETYITEKLMSPKSVIRNMEKVDVKGVPLEYTLAAQGFSMTYTATKVEEKVDPAAFAIPEGYEEMSIEDFMKTMGSMGGGMGF
jgi:hypothetical protein